MSNPTGTGDRSAGGPDNSPAGQWPVTADDPNASGAGAVGGILRTADAATGSGPYVDPAEDLMRVGATSGMSTAMEPGITWTSDLSEQYRQRWSQQFGNGGGRWEDAEPGYRFGHEMASRSRFQGRNFDDAESELTTEYNQWSQSAGMNPIEGGWSKVKSAARDAWNSVRGG